LHSARTRRRDRHSLQQIKYLRTVRRRYSEDQSLKQRNL